MLCVGMQMRAHVSDQSLCIPTVDRGNEKRSHEGVMPSSLWLIVRGALSFGVALALTPLAAVILPTSVIANFGGAFVLGALAGIGISYGSGSEARSATAFGCGFVIAIAMVMFSLISIQGGGRPDFTWGAIAGGIGLGIAGAMGGASIRLVFLIPGAIAFGVGGAIGGFLSFKAIDLNYGLESLVVAWGLAGTIAGGLFGAAIAASSR